MKLVLIIADQRKLLLWFNVPNYGSRVFFFIQLVVAMCSRERAINYFFSQA